MSEYFLLNVVVAGTLVNVALIVVASIMFGRIVTLVYRANRRVALADEKNLAAHRMYWAALDAARRQGARS